jgi:hypothetical protein
MAVLYKHQSHLLLPVLFPLCVETPRSLLCFHTFVVLFDVFQLIQKLSFLASPLCLIIELNTSSYSPIGSDGILCWSWQKTLLE